MAAKMATKLLKCHIMNPYYTFSYTPGQDPLQDPFPHALHHAHKIVRTADSAPVHVPLQDSVPVSLPHAQHVPLDAGDRCAAGHDDVIDDVIAEGGGNAQRYSILAVLKFTQCMFIFL